MNKLRNYKVSFDFGYDEKEIEAVSKVLEDNRWVWDKDQTEKLSEEFCDYFGSKYAIPVSTGSMGIVCTLAALGVGPGDEVITAANSFPAVPMYIMCLGAKPILTDVESDTLNINPDLIEKNISSKTKALLPIHSAGHPYDIDLVWEIAETHDLPVVHDAAQSMGAKYKGKFLGQFPDVTVFSFAVHKHVCVNGGIVLTNDEDLYREIWAKKFQGRYPGQKTQICETWGFSARMLEVIAALSRVQFKKFRDGPQQVKKRRSIANLYNELLDEVPQIEKPIEKDWAYHSYCRYIIRAENRDKLFDYLHNKGIEVFKHYESPLHEHPFMIERYGSHTGKYPVSEKTSKEVLTLPSWPYQTAQDIEYTINTVKEFYS